jgi:hypothetical protein
MERVHGLLGDQVIALAATFLKQRRLQITYLKITMVLGRQSFICFA